MKPKLFYTPAEAAELTGISKRAITKRLDRKTLEVIWITRGGRRRRMITHHALAAAGLLSNGRATEPTQEHGKIDWLIAYLKRHPCRPFTTDELVPEFHDEVMRQTVRLKQSSTIPELDEVGMHIQQGPEDDSGLHRQTRETVLNTLSVLGLVRKTLEPPGRGTGRLRNVWRWVGASCA